MRVFWYSFLCCYTELNDDCVALVQRKNKEVAEKEEKTRTIHILYISQYTTNLRGFYPVLFFSSITHSLFFSFVGGVGAF